MLLNFAKKQINMKKLLLSLSIALVPTINSFAQAIPNPSFENWNTINYEEPIPWNSSNHDNIRLGIPANVTKVTGVTGFAVHLETIMNATDTSFAFISNANGDPMSGKGGVPFSQLPTTITGSYRYDLGTTDTAIIIVFFKKNGAVISQDLIQIRGTGVQSAFTTFSYPVNVSVVPDSVIIAAASSNAISNIGIQNGSFLELDNLGFAGPGVTQTLLGGDFENWLPQTSDQILGWFEQGEGVTKVSPGYNGNFAVQLETFDYGSGGIWGSGIGSGPSTQSGPSGGLPYTLQNDTLCGYYQYFTTGNDSAMIYNNLKLNGANVGGGSKNFGPAASWTYFEIHLGSFTTPDSLYVGATSSSNWPVNNATVGSRLLLDNLFLKSQLVGLKSNYPFEMFISIYPNPTTDVLNLNWNKKLNDNAILTIYSLSGQLVYSETLLNGSASKQLDVKNYTDGTYLISIESSSKVLRTAFIKK